MAEVLTARFDLPADSRAAGRARRLVTELLASWGRHEDTEVARLLVSEVVTNAVRHAGRGQPLEIRVTADHVRVRVAVGDGSPVRPMPRVPRDDEETGRGMHLIAALASEWGVVDRPVESGPGKQVWFELPSVGDAEGDPLAAAPFTTSPPLAPGPLDPPVRGPLDPPPLGGPPGPEPPLEGPGPRPGGGPVTTTG